ncbi:MAG: hypothetical protein IJC70_03800 [Firmicutes bacterium]|nr:hypothetical protein [Bacillota bacterium]
MNVLLVMSIFWILYGIAGLLGYQNINKKYRGHSWTPDYIRCQGASWLMLGVPLLIFDRVLKLCFTNVHIGVGMMLTIVIILAAPSLIFTVIWEKKFNALLNADE